MTITRLVIGTTNPAKLAEWQAFLHPANITLLGLSDFSQRIDIAETGSTFAENARLKATGYATALGEYVYSDDGGFEIDALHGWPGVKSHRLLPDGSEASDEQIISYTLEKMANVPPQNRQARLVIHSAIASPTGDIIFEGKGSMEGLVTISPGPVSIPGYPFRSILYLPQLSKTYAELTQEEHDQYNHKKPIAEKMIQFLSQNR
jgi:XTP/dITP diphosphohydrolase